MRSSSRYVHGIQCPMCGDRIWSRHRHDMRDCNCGYCYVDGGIDYIRTGFGGKGWDTEACPSPLPIRIRVTEEEYKIAENYNRGFPY